MDRKELIEKLHDIVCRSRFNHIEHDQTVGEILNVFDKYNKRKNQTDFTQEEIDLPLEKLNIFNQWFQYRRSIRKTIKAKGTIQKLVKKFREEPIEVITDVVNHSIENGYQGLFWDKFKTKTNDQRSSNTGQISGW